MTKFRCLTMDTSADSVSVSSLEHRHSACCSMPLIAVRRKRSAKLPI